MIKTSALLTENARALLEKLSVCLSISFIFIAYLLDFSRVFNSVKPEHFRVHLRDRPTSFLCVCFYILYVIYFYRFET